MYERDEGNATECKDPETCSLFVVVFPPCRPTTMEQPPSSSSTQDSALEPPHASDSLAVESGSVAVESGSVAVESGSVAVERGGVVGRDDGSAVEVGGAGMRVGRVGERRPEAGVRAPRAPTCPSVGVSSVRCSDLVSSSSPSSHSLTLSPSHSLTLSLSHSLCGLSDLFSMASASMTARPIRSITCLCC
jgi:hypothetical protein